MKATEQKETIMNAFLFFISLIFAIIFVPLGAHQAYLEFMQQDAGSWPVIMLGAFFLLATIQRFRVWRGWV